MFDDFRSGQPIAVSMFENSILNDKLSHAYLIDTNNYSKAFELVLCFVKEIICCNIKSDEEKTNICNRIDAGNYLELKIIENDGVWIKKEQLVELQDEFSLKGLEGDRRIYIIKDCDKMNVQTANSILKFLEEPAENIIAILMTNDISKLLDTIVSRCQYVKFINDKENFVTTIDKIRLTLLDKNDDIEIEKIELLVSNFLIFLKYYESNGVSVIVDIKKKWHMYFNTRELVDLALDLWINFYYDILCYYSGKDILFFTDYSNDINEISNINTLDTILYKLEILIDFKSYLKYNLNLNLFIDKLIIDMAGE